MATRLIGGGAVVLLLGCAAFQVNPALNEVDESTGYRYGTLERPPLNSEKTFVVLTLSGGGTRAAALAYGVMRHLEDTPIDGGRKTLLDEVDVMSSVSGGSFAAAYFALSDSKREFFGEFPDAVLYRKIQSALIRRLLAPWNWPRLLSPRFGRSDLFNRYYDRAIFRGATYGDLPRRLPFAILNGTDMSLGAQFPFTQDGFDRLCSDLSAVKLSRAVISSSAFPGAFTPLTWRNYPKERCGYTEPDWVDLALGSDSEECAVDSTCRGDLESNPRRFDRARVWRAYEDPVRPFVHVLDGGVADNIGLRDPIVAMTTGDSSWSVPSKVNLEEIDRLAVIVVDAKPRDRPQRDRKASPPNILSVLSAAASKPMANYSSDTVELLRNRFREWDNAAADYDAQRPLCGELARLACPGSADPDCGMSAEAQCHELFALTDEDRPPHPELYRVHVRFDAVGDPELRRELQQVPTSLQLSRELVDKVVSVAGPLLEESAEYQRLKRDLH
jgi:predicted acylesterase/phospholipase RssA